MKRPLFITIIIAGVLAAMNHTAAQEQDTLDYREGYRLVLEQQWNEAQARFIEFQAAWPESVWADDAAFWNCYAIEQAEAASDDSGHFDCYRDFVRNFPESTWVADAGSRLAVLAARLSDLGNPEFAVSILRAEDFDFDWDPDDLQEIVEDAMIVAEREMSRLQEQGIFLAPDLPEVDVIPEQERIRIHVDGLNANVDRMRAELERTRRTTRRVRNPADDELLAIVSALRDDARASEVLIRRLQDSDNADFRARLVLLLEDLPGDDIDATLRDIIADDESEKVRHDAVRVLLDRDEPGSRELLIDIATDPAWPTPLRSEIVDEMAHWEPESVLPALDELLQGESSPALVAEAADALSDLGTEEALAILLESWESNGSARNRHLILEEIADVQSPAVLQFLNEVALAEGDDEAAVIAIEGIADREDNIAVAALEHVYTLADNLQRRLAAVDGIGESETEQAVEVLARIIHDESGTEILAAVARALGDTERASAVPLLVALYHDNDDETIRRNAVRALRRLNEHPEAGDALLEILQNRLEESAN